MHAFHVFLSTITSHHHTMYFVIVFIIYFLLFCYKLEKGKNYVFLIAFSEIHTQGMLSIDHRW